MLSIKAYIVGGSILLAISAGALYVRERDSRIRNQAVAAERIKRDSVELIGLRDSLKTQQSLTNRASATLDTAEKEFNRLRLLVKNGQRAGKIDTLKVGDTVYVTREIFVTDTQFVNAADTLAKKCSILQTECEKERAASKRVIANLDSQIKSLKFMVASQPSKKEKWIERFVIAGTSIGIGYGTCKLEGN